VWEQTTRSNATGKTAPCGLHKYNEPRGLQEVGKGMCIGAAEQSGSEAVRIGHVGMGGV